MSDEESEAKIYENDGTAPEIVEVSIEEESKDMFDDVFGEDEEKKQAKLKLREKAHELRKHREKEALDKKAAEEELENAKEEQEITASEDENPPSAKKKKDTSKIKSDAEDDDDEEIAEESDSGSEPVLFGEVGVHEGSSNRKENTSIKDTATQENEESFETLDDVEEGMDAGSLAKTKKESNFDELIEEGMEKSINSVSNGGGKLNLKVTQEDDEKEEIKKKHPSEKNIIKSVIRNKAIESAKQEIARDDALEEENEAPSTDDDDSDDDSTPSSKKKRKRDIEEEHPHDEDAFYDLLREDGTREDGAGEREERIRTLNREIDVEEETGDEKIIQPKLNFLTASSGHAYIGRKKSVLAKYGEEAGLYLGRVYEKDLEGTDIYLDGLNPHVVFVCGARGSGKSYVLGVVAEELALKNKNVGIVVVDPIGVFWSMKHPNKEEKELEALAKWGIMPQGLDNVKVFIPIGMKASVPKSTFDAVFSIQPALLTADDWCLTFSIDRFSPTGLLMEKGITKAKKGYTTTEGKQIRGKENTFSLEDLINCFEEDAELNDANRGYKADSIRALVSRFDAAKNWGIFDEKGTPLGQLSRAGQMTILDTSFLEDNVGALVIGIIARRLLSARKLGTRREAAEKFDDLKMDDIVELNIPPTWLFIDEAHTLIPGGNQKTPASNAIVEYVKQGRRPGCSLVFATQQPSAIDSKVLSQLDVIMAHKLVFDDDIKSIYKRTPAIIPFAYKKPNFIKTMPVGIALTGDRSETSSRAFVMSIRPRMSQHEGRDAETVEVKQELEDNQVETLAVNIALRQLGKDPKISFEALTETLETLNNTYKKNITLDAILAGLAAKGIVAQGSFVLAPGVKEEEEAENASELAKQKAQALKERKEAQSANAGKKGEDIVRDIVEEHDTMKSGVELVALHQSIDEANARKRLDLLRKRKTLGLFGSEEIIDRLSLKYAIIYRLRFNYSSHKEAFQAGEVYVNSLTGEFIHDLNGKLVESKGLPWLLKLSDSESAAFKLLEKKRSAEELAKLMRMEKGNASRLIDALIKKDLVMQIPQKDHMLYQLKLKIDLPANPLHAIMSSIGKRPIKEVEAIALIQPNIHEKDLGGLLKKMWGNITVKEVSQLFLPVWEGVMKKTTGEERTERIDAINGNRIAF